MKLVLSWYFESFLSSSSSSSSAAAAAAAAQLYFEIF